MRTAEAGTVPSATLAARHNVAMARAALVLSDPPTGLSGKDASREINDAIQSLHQLIDAAPTEPQAMSLLAAVLYRRGGPPGVREAVRVLRHARRLNPDDHIVAGAYAAALAGLDSHWPAGAGTTAVSACSYAVPWQADSRLPASTEESGDWKPLLYTFDGGNMLSTWLELGSEPATADCAASATWVSDLACMSAADAVVFDCPDGTEEQHPTTALLQDAGKPRNQLWVLLCGESAGRLPLLTNAPFMTRFDIRVTHQPDADLTFSYVPRRAAIFTDSAPQPKTHFANWIASNCVEHRVQRVQALMNALCPVASGSDDCRKVDCLGGCLRNTAWPADGTVEQLHGSTKIALLARYKFTLAFENSKAEGYVTEKFFQPLIAGSVPVYWGAPDVAGFAPDPRSYINAEDFGSVQELAAHLSYLDQNDTAYNELLDWKSNPLSESFLARASESDVLGKVYGEGVQHRNPMGGWDPCSLNDLIRQRVLSSRASQDLIPGTDVQNGLVVAGAVSLLDGRGPSQGSEVWWMPVSAPQYQTHMFRLTEHTSSAAVIAQYCSRHPCGPANEAALKGAIDADMEQAAQRAKLEKAAGVTACMLTSRNEGFFSNVLQAVDGMMACAAKGLPSTVQWTAPDFPYRSDDGSEPNAWNQFFLPIGPVITQGVVDSGEVAVINGYTRLPRQVPTQFEAFANGRGDNVSTHAISATT